MPSAVLGEPGTSPQPPSPFCASRASQRAGRRGCRSLRRRAGPSPRTRSSSASPRRSRCCARRLTQRRDQVAAAERARVDARPPRARGSCGRSRRCVLSSPTLRAQVGDRGVAAARDVERIAAGGLQAEHRPAGDRGARGACSGDAPQPPSAFWTEREPAGGASPAGGRAPCGRRTDEQRRSDAQQGGRRADGRDAGATRTARGSGPASAPSPGPRPGRASTLPTAWATSKGTPATRGRGTAPATARLRRSPSKRSSAERRRRARASRTPRPASGARRCARPATSAAPSTPHIPQPAICHGVHGPWPNQKFETSAASAPTAKPGAGAERVAGEDDDVGRRLPRSGTARRRSARRRQAPPAPRPAPRPARAGASARTRRSRRADQAPSDQEAGHLPASAASQLTRPRLRAPVPPAARRPARA